MSGRGLGARELEGVRACWAGSDDDPLRLRATRAGGCAPARAGCTYSAGMAAEVLDGETVRRCCLSAGALGQTRAAIDSLNVFPVPGAGTGTGAE
jgi:hypothetical protein